MEKKTKGRRKLEMKKIGDIDALQVTFSKRRSGLFKKASELSTLCGAEIGIVVYSPAGRAFTFGQPGVDAVGDRFLGSNSDSGRRENPNQFPDPVEVHREVTIHHLSRRCMELSDQLEAQKKKHMALEERLRALAQGPWCALARGIEGLHSLGLEDLQNIAKGLEDLKVQADARANEVLNGAASPLGMPLAINPFQRVNPHRNEVANSAPHWFMGGVDPSSR